jgi:glutathione S-transferase
MGPHPWLTGPTLTLADLHAAPMFAYFRLADEGAKLMADHASLQRWWQAIAARPSMTATRSPLE